MFSDFSNVSGERHYGLDVYWVFIIYFRLGFFFLNKIFYIMTWVILDSNTQMGFAGFNGLSGWQASLGYISYWVERANGPKGLSIAIGSAMGVR